MALIQPPVLDRARSLFPYLASGGIYLNHAATSPLAVPVVAALSAHIDQRMNGDIDTYAADLPMVKSWRKHVQTLINAEGPERIAFTMNTSDALNIVAAGIPWKEDDHVILNNAEFPANLHPFLHLRRRGVHVDVLAGGERCRDAGDHRTGDHPFHTDARAECGPVPFRIPGRS